MELGGKVARRINIYTGGGEVKDEFMVGGFHNSSSVNLRTCLISAPFVNLRTAHRSRRSFPLAKRERIILARELEAVVASPPL